MKKKKPTLGGKRTGSGRKKLGHSRLQLYVMPDAITGFETRAKQVGKSPADYFNMIFSGTKMEEMCALDLTKL